MVDQDILQLLYIRFEHAYQCVIDERKQKIRDAHKAGATRQQLFVVARDGYAPESLEVTSRFIDEALAS